MPNNAKQNLLWLTVSSLWFAAIQSTPLNEETPTANQRVHIINFETPHKKAPPPQSSTPEEQVGAEKKETPNSMPQSIFHGKRLLFHWVKPSRAQPIMPMDCCCSESWSKDIQSKHMVFWTLFGLCKMGRRFPVSYPCISHASVYPRIARSNHSPQLIPTIELRSPFKVEKGCYSSGRLLVCASCLVILWHVLPVLRV